MFAHTGDEKLNESYRYALSTSEKNHVKTFASKNIKPTIVAIYDQNTGVECTDQAIDHFTSKGIEVIKIPSAEGLNHPIFKSFQFNGIYLTGGPDISASDPRTTFEGQLLAIANERDIPLMGICRGLQAMGYHSGYELKNGDADEHMHKDVKKGTNNTVVVQPGNQLYHALQHKLKKGNDSQPIIYPVLCLHMQHIENNSNKELTITALSQFDGCIESVEKSTGKYTSFALQHHPEVLNQRERLGKHYLITLNADIETLEDSISMKEKMIKGTEERIKKFEQEIRSWPERMSESQRQFLESMRPSSPYTINEVKQDKEKLERFKKEKQGIEKFLQSIEYKTARAELGLFTKQVKKHFLEKHSEVRDECRLTSAIVR